MEKQFEDLAWKERQQNNSNTSTALFQVVSEYFDLRSYRIVRPTPAFATFK